MDAPSFLDPHQTAHIRQPSIREWFSATAKLVLGIGLFFGVARLIPPDFPYLIGWVGMIGIVMILHFGIFHLLSCLWRRTGVNAKQLMDVPLTSTSLSEFWGKCWNAAFRDLTYRFLFRPLTPMFGARGAILVAFVFSGLVHDVVISYPARGGYGGPTLFFALNGATILVERSKIARKIGLGNGLLGRLFTMLVLLGLVSSLFHPPFVVRIVVPFMRAMGAT